MSEKTHEFACTGPIEAEVVLGAGDIIVSTTDALVATVVVRSRDGRDASNHAVEQTKVEFDRDRLTVHAPDQRGWSLRWGSGQLQIEVTLPHDSGLRTLGGSTDVRQSGRLGRFEAKTGSGDVTLADTSGNVRVESGSGDVRALTVGGELSVNTASGDVSVNRAGGDLTVKAASADVRVDEALGQVRVNTASGDVQVGAMRGPALQVNSASGDVVVGVPIGTRVWLDLSTLSGSTRSDLEMSGGPSAGPSDEAATSVQVRTMSGDVHIRRVGSRSDVPQM
jgi:DUF4097 and DUF4098 domain-containing protein YvlB